MTLTEFLLARIAEDEEWARWAGIAQDAERSRGVAFVSSLGSSSVTSSGRVLADCEAKRRIVEFWPHHSDGAYKEYVLRALASVYADHEDFREEWLPLRRSC